MPYKQPKNTPMHNDGASEPITAGILAALKIGKIAAVGIKAAKAAKLAKLGAAGIKAAKGAKGIKAGMTTLKASKALKAGKAATTAGKAAKGARLTAKAGKLSAKAGKLTAKNAAKVAKGPSKIGKLASKVGDKAKGVKDKVDKGFEKLESATGGQLGNAEELKQKAGDQIRTKAVEGLQKGVANKREEDEERSGRISSAVSGQIESMRSKPSSGGGYSNPDGASLPDPNGATPIQANPGGNSSNQNLLSEEDQKEQVDSLADSNMNKLAPTSSLPESLDIKGFSVPLAGMARLGKALASGVDKKYNKARKTLTTPDISSVMKGNKSASSAKSSGLFAKIAKKLKSKKKGASPNISGTSQSKTFNISKQKTKK